MKLVDANALIDEYPNRRSLTATLKKADGYESIRDIVEDIKIDMCENYCKIPLKYSKAEWEQRLENIDEPIECNNCPLSML